MKLLRGTIVRGAGVAATCVLMAAAVYGQAPPAGQATGPRPQLAEEAFKNVRMLRGIPVKEFMGTMGFFSASLGLNCTDCHGGASASDWANYAVDTPLKNRARQMMAMVTAINKANFGGRPFVTCYTCHRGTQRPKAIPSLAVQYGEPPPEDPDEVEVFPGARQTATPDQILDKYIAAIGGTQALAKLTSFTAKGTYEGFDSDFAKAPVDIYAKSPDLRATVVHMLGGDVTSTFDGREAWHASPATLAPVPLMPLVGADLGGARLDAQLSFPGQIKQLLTNWRADFPAVTIDDKPVQVVQGSMADGTRVKLYFDRASGLLVRQTRFTPTAVGTIPTHIIYSDYRPLPGLGVQLPFTWQVTWVDGQSTINVTEVQPNAPIDAARFARPAPPR
jgi:photosynthetic reaction center cytochrome c subunit